MTFILSISIGVGLAVTLLFSEFFGLAAGGMVVPGYIALYLDHPLNVVMTILVGLVTYGLIQLLSPFIILYGRRRTVLMILCGYLVGMGVRYLFPDLTTLLGAEFEIIGFIIPGLLAIWLDRQGVVETLSTLLIVAVIVRLLLILLLGEDLRI